MQVPPGSPKFGQAAGTAGWPGRVPVAAALVLAALLPTVGLLSGPIYAPLLFAAAAAGLLTILLRRPALLQPDRPLWLLAGLFIVWCWLSLLWTISHARTAAGALQASFVLPAALALLQASRLYPASRRQTLATVLTVAAVFGLLIIGTDRLDGFRLLRLLDGHKTWPTKYNRGIDHALLILLPVLGYWVSRRRWVVAAALGLALCLIVAAGRNTTAQVALPAAALIAGLAAWSPRVAAGGLAVLTTLEALTLPFLMRVVDGLRPDIARHIKMSAVERLEIWDYLSAHALQRPFIGWGLWTSRLLPATPEEMAHFIKATGSGIYAHNHWLELWVELGLPGVFCGLAFALIVLFRAARNPMAPFALAACTAALCVASSGFEITTDSWWAALACSGALFALLPQEGATSATSAGTARK